MLKVADALKIGPLINAKVVGGANGLNRKIRSVNVMDAPDIVDWVKEGELILTTAFSIKDNMSAQTKLVSDLAERGCAGLAIKFKRFLTELPDHMMQEADIKHFPLIELPQEYSFADIMIPLLSAMLDNRNSMLERSISIHKRLTDVALEGKGIKSILNTLTDLVGNPVYFFNSEGVLIASSENRKPEKKCMVILNDYLKQDKLYETLSKKPQEIPNYCLIIPIIAHRLTIGFLLSCACNREYRSFDTIAMEHAATVIAIYLMRKKAIDETAEQIKTDFLVDLLSGNINDSFVFFERIKSLGFMDNSYYGCIIFDFKDLQNFNVRYPENRENNAQLLKSRLANQLERSFNILGMQVIIVKKNNQIFSFIPYKSRAQWEPKIFLNTIIEDLNNIYPLVEINIGYSRVGPINELYYICNEAIESLEIGSKLFNKNQIIVGYREMEIYKILHNSLTEKNLERFIDQSIGPLLVHDQGKDTELLKTLESYIKCQGNITKAARDLYIHRNTLIYRLEKIQALLPNKNINDAEDMLYLQLGIKAAMLLNS